VNRRAKLTHSGTLIYPLRIQLEEGDSKGDTEGEDIKKIRIAHFVEGKSIREICSKFGVARNTVRSSIRSGKTDHDYVRSEQAYPKLGPFPGALPIKDGGPGYFPQNDKSPRPYRHFLSKFWSKPRAVCRQLRDIVGFKWSGKRDSNQANPMNSFYVSELKANKIK